MASRAHQFMLNLLVRKMKSLGFEPIAYDGNSDLIGINKLKMPPTIQHHRPDIIGIDCNQKLCIGEIKTENDLTSKRTRQQLIDFSKDHHFIIGTTIKAQRTLSNKLNKLGLLFKRNVDLFFVPEELIPHDEENL